MRVWLGTYVNVQIVDDVFWIIPPSKVMITQRKNHKVSHKVSHGDSHHQKKVQLPKMTRKKAKKKEEKAEAERLPFLLRPRFFRHDLSRQQLVVPEMQVMLRFLIGHVDLGEPFDGTTPDLTRDDKPDRETYITV